MNSIHFDELYPLLESAHGLLAKEDYDLFIQIMEPFHLLYSEGKQPYLLANEMGLDRQSVLLLVCRLSNMIDLIEQKNHTISAQLSKLRTQLRAINSYQK